MVQTKIMTKNKDKKLCNNTKKKVEILCSRKNITQIINMLYLQGGRIKIGEKVLQLG